MAELPTERFMVNDTSSGLYEWLSDLGVIVGRSAPSTKHEWRCSIIPDATVLMKFDTKVRPLDVVATLVTTQDDAGSWTFDGDLVALASFRALCEEIRAKYPQAGNEEHRPRIALQVATTAAHYGYVRKLAKTQIAAAERMDTSDRTYRKYRDNQWFLDEQEFKRRTGKTIAEYWDSKK